MFFFVCMCVYMEFVVSPLVWMVKVKPVSFER